MNFNAKLEYLDWSRGELSRRLGIHRNTISKWKDGCPGYADAYLDLAIGFFDYRSGVRKLAKQMLPSDDSSFDRTAYQREYMRKRRAKKS